MTAPPSPPDDLAARRTRNAAQGAATALDRHIMIVGPPGCGKTTLAKQSAARFIATGGWVITYDPKKQFAPPCAAYEDRAALRAATAKGQPPIPFGISIQRGGADAVVTLAVEWAKRSPKRRTRLIIDESSSMRVSGKTWMGAEHGEMLAQRRHFGAGLETYFLIQRPTMLTADWYDDATAVVLYRMTSQRRIAYMEEALSIEGLGDVLPRLRDYEYVVVKPGRGFVRDFMP